VLKEKHIFISLKNEHLLLSDMSDLAIIPCPECGVKNRIRTYDSEKIPVCAKCKAKLVGEKEHAAFSRFNENLNQFKDFPDFGSRSSKK
jgi:uncharacterized paraquat-inducible protein A